MPPEPLLSVQELVVRFDAERGTLRAVDDVSFDVPEGTTVALVGESGSGKSVTALAILRLIASPPGSIEHGKVLFEGRDLLTLPEPEMRAVRGARLSIVFQEPMTALNPVYTVGAQIGEVIRLHEKASRKEARKRSVELLGLVGIPSPEERADAYPHELSGGMRQRVLIAMALACKPKLLIADEPTTALDVSVQAQILELLARRKEATGMSMLFITHDLGVVAEIADEVVVLYAGRVVESAKVTLLFADPRHPYTRALLASAPPLDSSRRADRPARLDAIEGIVPDLAALPPGCRFAERCALLRSKPPGHERCTTDEPPLATLADGRRVRCYYGEGTA
ncbi:MAG TPA: ABC transporter ATP-binding protein [Polyangiaceae bacterium]|jgi:oligopeptide/dipeptide ABC transporter ATP-binding protein|nr:ABC transporter ATP-binding protein [Polyangiaceae bacterium]